MSPALDVPEGYKLTEAVLSTRKQWPIARLGAVATLQRGYDLPHRERKPGVVPIVTSSGFGATHSEARVCGPGVVTGRYGTIGDVYVVEEDFWPLNTTLYVKDFHDNDPAFVAHLLRTIDFHMHSGKSGVPGVNRNDLHEIDVRVPPLHEQRAIATALSDVDALLAKLDQLIAKKRDLKQAAMQQLVTGQTRLPGFSGEWEVKRLGDVAHIKTGARNNDDKVEDGEYPLFVRSQTVERISTYSYDCEAILVPGEGGIGSIFHYINGKFDCHQRVYKISAFNADTCGKFVFFCMKHLFHKQATRNSVKATVDSLRLPTFLEFEFVAPAREEQEAIVTLLSDMDAELAALEARRDKTRALKQGMMQALLTGRIRLI